MLRSKWKKSILFGKAAQNLNEFRGNGVRWKWNYSLPVWNKKYIFTVYSLYNLWTYGVLCLEKWHNNANVSVGGWLKILSHGVIHFLLLYQCIKFKWTRFDYLKKTRHLTTLTQFSFTSGVKVKQCRSLICPKRSKGSIYRAINLILIVIVSISEFDVFLSWPKSNCYRNNFYMNETVTSDFTDLVLTE